MGATDTGQPVGWGVHKHGGTTFQHSRTRSHSMACSPELLASTRDHEPRQNAPSSWSSIQRRAWAGRVGRRDSRARTAAREIPNWAVGSTQKKSDLIFQEAERSLRDGKRKLLTHRINPESSSSQLRRLPEQHSKMWFVCEK